MANLKKLVTGKILDALKKMADDDKEKYELFWKELGRFLKQGVALDERDPEELYPLLRFHTSTHPEQWSSLDEYVERMQPDQKEIFYIMGDDDRSILYSPHLDIIQRFNYEALLLTDPVDAFMIVRLLKYKDYSLVNVASPTLQLPDQPVEQSAESEQVQPIAEAEVLVNRFKTHLADQVAEVRVTDRLSEAPARLVNPSGAPTQEMLRMYHLLNRELESPKKILELNPRHPILVRLAALPDDDPLTGLLVDQIYEDTLLIEGLHPDPASMVKRIQRLMEIALR